MTDEAKALVERLQSPALVFLTDTPASASILSKLGEEAADLIETQAREIERLREALEWYVAEDEKYIRAALAGDSHDQ